MEGAEKKLAVLHSIYEVRRHPVGTPVSVLEIEQN
jgi:hypothetical protein